MAGTRGAAIGLRRAATDLRGAGPAGYRRGGRTLPAPDGRGPAPEENCGGAPRDGTAPGAPPCRTEFREGLWHRIRPAGVSGSSSQGSTGE